MLEVTSPALHNLLITQANKQTIDHSSPWQEVDYRKGPRSGTHVLHKHVKLSLHTVTHQLRPHDLKNSKEYLNLTILMEFQPLDKHQENVEQTSRDAIHLTNPSADFGPYLGISYIHCVLNDLSLLMALLVAGCICSPTSSPFVRENVKKADLTRPANDLVAYTHTPESFLINSSIVACNRHNG